MRSFCNYLRRHHIGVLALFVALGGTSYAAIKLPANTVGTKQIRDRAVTLKKIGLGTQKALKGARGQRGARGDVGPQGVRGPEGARGPAGANALGARSFDKHFPFNSLAPLPVGPGEIDEVCAAENGTLANGTSKVALTIHDNLSGHGAELSGFAGEDDAVSTVSGDSGGAAGVNHVYLDITARELGDPGNPSEKPSAWVRVSLGAERDATGCHVWGTYVPTTDIGD